MYKGKRLNQGDTIGLIAPAGPLTKHEIVQARESLEGLGYRVTLGSHCLKTYGGYLAGSPQDRVADIHAMFMDDSVDAIFCLRGGYGSVQLLDLLDFQLIKEHPKVFIGFSDITALHLAFHQKSNLATIHGPVASQEIHSLPSVSKDYLFKAITQAAPLGKIHNPAGIKIETLVTGKATGKIIGGNLSLISATMGTPYEINTTGKLLFLEDVNEEPYRIDRMLTQLALAGKFEQAAGIILGSWHKCQTDQPKDSFTVKDLFNQIIKPFGKPTIYNLQAGHDAYNLTVPFGVEATIDATNRELTIHESVVI